MVAHSDYRDSAWVASAVRSLAGDVHRLTSRGEGDASEVEELNGRIRMVRDQLPETTTPLHRWLDGLAQQVGAVPTNSATCV